MSALNPSREAILDAAEQLFATKGLAATTIKDIGEAAGTNTALLYYYFPDKDGLYREVLARTAGLMIHGGVEALRTAASPEDGIRALVRAQVAVLSARPTLPALLAREMLDHDARRGETLIQQAATELFARVCRLIEAGQAAGHFRRDVDPRLAAISTISQAMHFVIFQPAIRVMMSSTKQPEATGDSYPSLQAFGEHAAEFAVRALLADDKTDRIQETKPRLSEVS